MPEKLWADAMVTHIVQRRGSQKLVLSEHRQWGFAVKGMNARESVQTRVTWHPLVSVVAIPGVGRVSLVRNVPQVSHQILDLPLNFCDVWDRGHNLLMVLKHEATGVGGSQRWHLLNLLREAKFHHRVFNAHEDNR